MTERKQKSASSRKSTREPSIDEIAGAYVDDGTDISRKRVVQPYKADDALRDAKAVVENQGFKALSCPNLVAAVFTKLAGKH